MGTEKGGPRTENPSPITHSVTHSPLTHHSVTHTPLTHHSGTHSPLTHHDTGIFWGTIVHHYPDDPSLCQVCYTDGDKEDLDTDEISYAIDLYRKHFVDHV